MQPILKYLSMVAIQYNFIGLMNIILLWLYKGPCRLHHVVTCSNQSVSYLSIVEMQGCLFHKCSECSLSNAIISFLTCQNEVKDTFPNSLVPNKSTVPHLVNYFCDRRSSPVCIRHEEKSECMYHWTKTFLALNVTLIFVFWFQYNLFFLQVEHVWGMDCMTFRSPCVSVVDILSHFSSSPWWFIHIKDKSTFIQFCLFQVA
jgi:hypothetical protein